MFVLKRIATKKTSSVLAPLFNRIGKPVKYSKIITSGLPDVEIPELSISEYVLENSSNWENHTAVECAVTGRNYTFKQIRTKSKNLSASLRKKLKLEKGDVIALLLPNVPEYAIVTLGALRAGLTCTTINPIYTPAEIARQLLDSSTKALITLNELWNLADLSRSITKRNIPIISIKTEIIHWNVSTLHEADRPARATLTTTVALHCLFHSLSGDGGSKSVIIFGSNNPPYIMSVYTPAEKHLQTFPEGAINFAEFIDNEVDCPEVTITSEDLAILPYSSGTTGLPKGVQLTHSNIVSNLCQLEHPLIGCTQKTTANHQDVTPAVLPMFHIYGLTVLCLYHLRLGSKVITLPKFTPELYITTIRNQKPDILYVAPPLAIFLANHPAVKMEDFNNVRTITTGAAPLGVLDAAKLLKKANKDIPILQGYGLTETSPAVLSTRISHLNNKNAVGALGLPLPNTEVKIVAPDDTTGNALGPNQSGELLVRGPQVMKGYLNRPEENIFIEGWMRTGDMMYYNDEGFLFITDRLKELIKVKGYQVAPAELEELIRDFPNVADAAVIGIPHKIDGEVPRAYVVPQQGTNIQVEKLKEYVNSQVAPYKRVKGGISIINSIPKSAAGKILRRELKQLYEKEIKN